jgi:hypothetical protein
VRGEGIGEGRRRGKEVRGVRRGSVGVRDRKGREEEVRGRGVRESVWADIYPHTRRYGETEVLYLRAIAD